MVCLVLLLHYTGPVASVQYSIHRTLQYWCRETRIGVFIIFFPKNSPRAGYDDCSGCTNIRYVAKSVYSD